MKILIWEEYHLRNVEDYVRNRMAAHEGRPNEVPAFNAAAFVEEYDDQARRFADHAVVGLRQVHSLKDIPTMIRCWYWRNRYGIESKIKFEIRLKK